MGLDQESKVHLRVWMLPYISSFQILGLYGSGSGNAQGVKIRIRKWGRGPNDTTAVLLL